MESEGLVRPVPLNRCVLNRFSAVFTGSINRDYPVVQIHDNTDDCPVISHLIFQTHRFQVIAHRFLDPLRTNNVTVFRGHW